MQTHAFVNEVVGRANVIRGDGAVEPLRQGDLLREGDFLLVSDGRVRIVFADGSSLTIIDSGQVLLKEVAYDPASNEGAVTLAVAAGHFQFISSALGEQSPAAIVVETPAATIRAGRSAFAFQHTSADGLDVSLLEALAADALPLIVDNDAGSAAISERGERVTVSGRGDAPVLEQDVTQAEPESTDVEVAAGGDEGASPGDPIVVTGGPDFFDLSPEPAPLPGPSSGTLQGPSPVIVPEHRDDLFFGGQAASSSTDETSSGSGSSSAGGSKYRTLTGWEPLGLVWELIGSGQVTGEAPTFPYGRDSRQIQPTEKNSMAGLALVSEQVPAVTLTEFFGEGSPAHFPQSSVEVSAIRAPLALSAGAELSFDFFFDAGDTLPRNDSAWAVIRNQSFYDQLELSNISRIAAECTRSASWRWTIG
jgi:FecR protein